MDTQQVPKNVKRFISTVKQKYNPQKVVIFGSYARGTAGKNSDVDIAVISDAFSKMSPFDRYSKLYDMSTEFYDPTIQAFGFTQEEMNNTKAIPIITKILEEGREV